MIELGFDGSLVCECLEIGNTYHILMPAPYISFALLLSDSGKDNKTALSNLLSCTIPYYLHDGIMLFREDSFDPVTRIRRGRFYKTADSNPQHCQVVPYPGAKQQDRSATLIVVQPTGERLDRKQLVAIGSPDSIWRVVASDRISTGEFLVTLKSRNAFGVIPEVEEDKLPEIHKEKIVSELDRFVDAANRETPGSIVDVARRMAVVLISSYLSPESKDSNIFKKDLGNLSGDLKKNKELSGAAAEVINKLHPRNKPNEQEKYSSRDISEEDAELAVSLIGFLLQEFGWVK